MRAHPPRSTVAAHVSEAAKVAAGQQVDTEVREVVHDRTTIEVAASDIGMQRISAKLKTGSRRSISPRFTAAILSRISDDRQREPSRSSSRCRYRCPATRWPRANVAAVRAFALIALVACGSSADPAPPKPAPPKQPSLLDEAARLASTPEDFLELGRTYVARGDTARARDALAKARPEKLADEVAALELRALLGERVDFAPTVELVAVRMEPPPGAFAAALDRADSLQGIAAVAAGLVVERDFADDLEEVEPRLTAGKLDALIAAAHGAPLMQIARIARHRSHPDARALAQRAAKEAPDRAAALELIFQGDRTTRLVPDDAELAALRGEPSKALAAAETPKQSIDGEDVDTNTDTAWAHLAIAAFARGEDGRAIVAQHPSLDTVSTVAWTLAELGRFADAAAIAGTDPRPREAIARVRIARGELAEAIALQPTFTDTLDALGRAGDTQRLAPLLRDRPAAVRAHALDLAARALAQRGDCARAIDLARTVKQAACYAVVARSCPG